MYRGKPLHVFLPQLEVVKPWAHLIGTCILRAVVISGGFLWWGFHCYASIKLFDPLDCVFVVVFVLPGPSLSASISLDDLSTSCFWLCWHAPLKVFPCLSSTVPIMPFLRQILSTLSGRHFYWFPYNKKHSNAHQRSQAIFSSTSDPRSLGNSSAVFFTGHPGSAVFPSSTISYFSPHVRATVATNRCSVFSPYSFVFLRFVRVVGSPV